MNRKPKIAIISGGIGGLAAAVALHKRDFEVDVFERVEQFGDIGAGLNLSPNALKAFRLLGVEKEMIAAGFQDKFQYARDWKSGAVKIQQSRLEGVVEKYGAGFLTIHRADVVTILLKNLPSAAVHFGAVCTAVENGQNNARAMFSDGRTVEADIVIGADGIHSVVSDSLFGKQPPRFTGTVCFRGMAPFEAVQHLPTVQGLNSWLGPAGHVVSYRVRQGEWINFVAHRDHDDWVGDSWTQECDKSELLETYAGWNETLLKLFEVSDHYYKWALFDRDPLEEWGRGAITLLGDAAHPMLPNLGQGATMALEDACILARVLESEPENTRAALRQYESIRRPRATQIQLGSRAQGKRNHLRSPLARAWRDIKLAMRSRFSKDKTTLRAEWIYHYDVATAPLK